MWTKVLRSPKKEAWPPGTKRAPGQTERGMIPWWTTCKNETWLNFLRATKQNWKMSCQKWVNIKTISYRMFYSLCQWIRWICWGSTYNKHEASEIVEEKRGNKSELERETPASRCSTKILPLLKCEYAVVILVLLLCLPTRLSGCRNNPQAGNGNCSHLPIPRTKAVKTSFFFFKVRSVKKSFMNFNTQIVWMMRKLMGWKFLP